MTRQISKVTHIATGAIVHITDSYYSGRYDQILNLKVETVDGSSPFMTRIARSDPEEPFPGWMATSWTWVEPSEIDIEFFPD